MVESVIGVSEVTGVGVVLWLRILHTKLGTTVAPNYMSAYHVTSLTIDYEVVERYQVILVVFWSVLCKTTVSVRINRLK